MEEPNWDEDFQAIVEGLDMGDMADPEAGVSLPELQDTVCHLQESALYLSRFVGRAMEDADLILPEGFINIVDSIDSLTMEMVTILADIEDNCECDECEAIRKQIEEM